MYARARNIMIHDAILLQCAMLNVEWWRVGGGTSDGHGARARGAVRGVFYVCISVTVCSMSRGERWVLWRADIMPDDIHMRDGEASASGD